MDNLEKLKRLILKSQDLSEPLGYFFELMDNDTIITIKGHRAIKNVNENVELHIIMDVLKSQIAKHLGITIHELVPLFCEISEHHFIHGACSPKESLLPITVIYFSDIKTGIFAVAKQETNIFRFSLMKVTEIPGKKVLH